MKTRSIIICILCACTFGSHAYGKCVRCAVQQDGFCPGNCKICGNGGCYGCCDATNGGDVPVGPVTPTCSAGKYASADECVSCPPSSDGCAVTSPYGSTSITQCYVKSGCAASDTTGNYTYTANCNYVK